MEERVIRTLGSFPDNAVIIYKPSKGRGVLFLTGKLKEKYNDIEFEIDGPDNRVIGVKPISEEIKQKLENEWESQTLKRTLEYEFKRFIKSSTCYNYFLSLWKNCLWPNLTCFDDIEEINWDKINSYEFDEYELALFDEEYEKQELEKYNIKKAEEKEAKNAAELGMSLEEYREMNEQTLRRLAEHFKEMFSLD